VSIFASAPVQHSAGDYIDVTRWNAEVYTKMTEIDALFSLTTGHDHSAADKGKPIITAGIADSAIATGKIADLAVATGKIADAAVTNAKIANSAVSNANISVTTALITNLNADLLDGYDSARFIRQVFEPPPGTKNYIIQGGYVAVTMTDGQGTITFPNAFSTACVASIAVGGAANNIITVPDRSATTLTIYGTWHDGSNLAGQVYVNWIAIGY